PLIQWVRSNHEWESGSFCIAMAGFSSGRGEERLGSTGSGTWALPGGKLEYQESFEACAARELEEETGVVATKFTFAYAVNSVLRDGGGHWVTIFMEADCPQDCEPANLEPDKCQGWEWVPFNAIPQPIFHPLACLLDSPFQLRIQGISAMASGEESRATRVWLQKQFRTSGLQLDPGALSYLVDAVQGLHDPEEYIHRIMDEASAGAQRRLTLESLEGLVRRLDGARAQTSGTQVIPAFQTPVLEYDPIRKQFHASPAPPRLFPEAKSKIALYVNRYHLVHQRLRRNRLFRPTHWAGVAGAQGQECEVGWSERVGSRHAGGQHVLGCARAGVPALGAPGASQDRRVLLEPARALCMAPPPPPSSTRQLTELKALLGLVGQSKYVLGFLSQPREGEYALEDLSARLPLDIQDAERTPGLFTENSIVVAEGQLQPSGRFKAVALGMPPPESRAASIEALQARLLWEKEERGLTPCGTLPSNQHTARQAFALLRPASKHHLITPLQGLVTFGGSEPDAKEAAAWDASHPDDATLLLSDVWLDDACAMANLEALLATLAEADASSQPPPSLIVLCGDFLSPAGRRAVEKSTLVLVPGPEDVGLGRALPHPGLPRAVLQGLLSAAPNTIVGSNPCRLRHGSCELVVLRSNLQCLLRGTAVVPPMPGSTPFQHAVASVAQQSHLCPVPLEVQPIHWEHDRALWLYPLPHALFLADSAPAGHHVYDSCVSLNPGSLVQGTYCSFNPVTRLGKVCSVQGKGEWQSQEAAVEMD
ncbi:hypothetical protein APUTEX25_000231, partial [Auxenochlorella protothecoides]